MNGYTLVCIILYYLSEGTQNACISIRNRLGPEITANHVSMVSKNLFIVGKVVKLLIIVIYLLDIYLTYTCKNPWQLCQVLVPSYEYVYNNL